MLVGLSILLAEDNKINQKLAIALLAGAGHRVDIVENGHQAVGAVRRGDYDIVLMDIQMPELDGIEATRQIRALPAPKGNTPIVAMTARAISGAREEYIAAGMNDYVSKPIDRQLLLYKLADLGQQYRAPPILPAIPSALNVILASDPDLNETLLAAGIDAASLEQLVDIMPLDDIREFVGMYVGDSAERIARMMSGDARDPEALSRDAHALVGVAGNVGAFRVVELARSVELACKGDPPGAAGDAICALAGAVKISASALVLWANTLECAAT
jgi:CheY-like chemotaxis protein